MASPTLVFNLSQVSNGSWSCRAASKLTSLTFASSQEGGHWTRVEKNFKHIVKIWEGALNLCPNNLKTMSSFNLLVYFLFSFQIINVL